MEGGLRWVMVGVWNCGGLIRWRGVLGMMRGRNVYYSSVLLGVCGATIVMLRSDYSFWIFEHIIYVG